MNKSRPVTEDDWPAIVALEKECFPDRAWSRKDYEAEMVLGAEGLVIGEPAVAAIWFQRNEIVSLAVTKKWRGLGLARRLLWDALDLIESKQEDCCPNPNREYLYGDAFLYVKPELIDALNLYLNVGFKPVKWDQNYYDKNDGGLLMVKKLRP
jgi:ribosomal protein S18 acetylase RimI-like enzyme